MNIVENIALIKEIHEHLETSIAQEEALSYLEKINMSHIKKLRISQCSEVETLYVMIIRALMTKEKTIVISRPFSIVHFLIDIKTIIDTILVLNNNKNILILDLSVNEAEYKKESRCNMIK